MLIFGRCILSSCGTKCVTQPALGFQKDYQTWPTCGLCNRLQWGSCKAGNSKLPSGHAAFVHYYAAFGMNELTNELYCD